MITPYLIILGSSVLVFLGSAHLYYTFFSNKFSTRDPETEKRMKQSFPILTKETTMWKAWVGFNASHSLGALFIGLANIIIAAEDFELYQRSVSLWVLNLASIFFYLFLARKYWFSIPFYGILIAAICLIISCLLITLR